MILDTDVTGLPGSVSGGGVTLTSLPDPLFLVVSSVSPSSFRLRGPFLRGLSPVRPLWSLRRHPKSLSLAPLELPHQRPPVPRLLQSPHLPRPESHLLRSLQTHPFPSRSTVLDPGPTLGGILKLVFTPGHKVTSPFVRRLLSPRLRVSFCDCRSSRPALVTPSG